MCKANMTLSTRDRHSNQLNYRTNKIRLQRIAFREFKPKIGRLIPYKK